VSRIRTEGARRDPFVDAQMLIAERRRQQAWSDPRTIDPLTSRSHRPGRAVTASGHVAAANLIDNTSSTQVMFPAGPASVSHHLDQAHQVTEYTPIAGARAGDPSGWTLQGSVDGSHWTIVDQRTYDRFTLRQQTRAFTTASPCAFSYYRIELAAGSTRPVSLRSGCSEPADARGPLPSGLDVAARRPGTAAQSCGLPPAAWDRLGGRARAT
jgi:hypothetical protein